MWVYVYDANDAISKMSTTETVGGQTIEIYDGQYFLQDGSDQYSMWTWERAFGYWERVQVYNSGTAKIYDISVLPAGGGYGGEIHKLTRLDYFNCIKYNMCKPTTWGSYYSLRQNANVYNASGSFVDSIDASLYDAVFDGGYGYTIANTPSSIPSYSFGMRVWGKRSRTSGTFYPYNAEYYLADVIKAHPSNYVVNTY